MDRVKIKKEAKEIVKIKGNKWKIWWPLLIISLVSSVLQNFISPDYGSLEFDFDNLEQLTQLNIPMPTPTQTVLSIIVALILGIAGVAYNRYLLKLVKGEEPEFNDIIECITKMKHKFMQSTYELALTLR